MRSFLLVSPRPVHGFHYHHVSARLRAEQSHAAALWQAGLCRAIRCASPRQFTLPTAEQTGAVALQIRVVVQNRSCSHTQSIATPTQSQFFFAVDAQEGHVAYQICALISAIWGTHIWAVRVSSLLLRRHILRWLFVCLRVPHTVPALLCSHGCICCAHEHATDVCAGSGVSCVDGTRHFRLQIPVLGAWSTIDCFKVAIGVSLCNNAVIYTAVVRQRRN